MSLFGKRKDEHDFIYDNGDDNGIDYSDLDENESPEEAIARLKETLGKGPCPKCGQESMVPHKNGFCYYCLDCGYAEHHDSYLRELAGYPVEYVD